MVAGEPGWRFWRGVGFMRGPIRTRPISGIGFSDVRSPEALETIIERNKQIPKNHIASTLTDSGRYQVQTNYSFEAMFFYALAIY